MALHVGVGGLTGGVQGAAGVGAASAAAPVIEQLQSQLQDGLQRAGLDPKASQGIARLVGGGAAASVGAAAGGGSTAGAAAAFNADMNNRQLHPSEVQRARELAARSGGKYTQAQIEEQMRLMGNAVTGEQPNTTTVVTTTEAIATSVQSDPGMPRTVQGPVVVEVPGRADSELQAWIVENTTQGSGYIPGQSPYTASNPALNGPVRTTGRIDAPTAATANNDLAGRSGIGVQQNAPLSQQAREAIADGASTLSRQAGVVSSGATAAMAGLPPQGRPIAGALAIGAGATGIAADVVEQVVRPNLGAAVADGAGTVVEGLVNRIPGARSIAPITNEVIELWRSSGSARSLQDWVNDQFKGDKP